MSPRTSPKRDFLEKMGLEKPIPQLLAAARKHRLDVSDTYIRLLRREKKVGANGVVKAKRERTRASGSEDVVATDGRAPDDVAFLRLALEIGVPRARKLLRGLEEILGTKSKA